MTDKDFELARKIEDMAAGGRHEAAPWRETEGMRRALARDGIKARARRDGREAWIKTWRR